MKSRRSLGPITRRSSVRSSPVPGSDVAVSDMWPPRCACSQTDVRSVANRGPDHRSGQQRRARRVALVTPTVAEPFAGRGAKGAQRPSLETTGPDEGGLEAPPSHLDHRGLHRRTPTRRD
ncbi:hypothetical protein GCM10009633_03670 [Janibacter melonis]